MNSTGVNKKTGKPLVGKGGAREGAGRKKGGSNQVTINGILESLEKRTNGKKYEEVLVEDFMTARNNNDQQLVVKYHNLILNKVMTHVSKIEITDSSEAIKVKEAIFVEALQKLTGLQNK
jgi:hypothetical protein